MTTEFPATANDAPATSRGAPATPGVLLAGGLARRMGGGDKPMRIIAGKTILDRVIARHTLEEGEWQPPKHDDGDGEERMP